MAIFMFWKAWEGLAGKAGSDSINWMSDNIKACLVDLDTWTPTQASDEFLTAASVIVATSGNFASKTNVLGACGAANITFSAVSGDQCEVLIIYKDTGSAGTTPPNTEKHKYRGLALRPDRDKINVL